MHIHILGICGTFMAGVAALAREAGHRVTGSDAGAWPPMSTQLEALGIEVLRGYDPAHLEPAPDMVVVGNVISRGNAAIEAVLDRGLPYMSGPQWLADTLLQDRWVLAVAGTHGKTTTASMLAWILEHAGLEPGFLIGGVPANFERSARLGAAPFFVVEADEYDTAFFDKRSKFVHYRPRTAILNNLEFDHADIFPDLAAIIRQFHHFVRTIPGQGLIVRPAVDAALDEVLALGCWTPVQAFGGQTDWTVEARAPDFSRFVVRAQGEECGTVNWAMRGRHNAENALAAVLAARHAGVATATGIEALSAFRGVARRLDFKGDFGGVRVYDDFAHHPTAIARTLAGVRPGLDGGRLFAVFEPRSNSLRAGAHVDQLAAAFADADAVFVFARDDLELDPRACLAALGPRLQVAGQLEQLVTQVSTAVRAGDLVLIMSNGDFGGFSGRLTAALEAAQQESR